MTAYVAPVDYAVAGCEHGGGSLHNAELRVIPDDDQPGARLLIAAHGFQTGQALGAALLGRDQVVSLSNHLTRWLRDGAL